VQARAADPLVKGAVIALIFAALVAAGIMMVPVLENYALSGILLTRRYSTACFS